MTGPGKVTISLDFEAGWGVIDNGKWRLREKAGVYDRLRPALRRFVAQLDATEISCIWAVVGGMVDDPALRDISHLKGSYRAKADRFLAEAKPATKDGRDLLDTVLAARCAQRFGTHGYSHVLFSDPEQDADVFAAELQRARAVNARYGLDAGFFVFPENRFGHLETVRAAGVSMVRMPALNASAQPGAGTAVSRAMGAVLRPPSPVAERQDASGLRLHHGTELLNWGAGAGAAKTWLTKRRIEGALRAARGGAHVHFWLHPFNLAETRGLLAYVEDLLSCLARWRDAGEIEISGLDLPVLGRPANPAPALAVVV